ncbi:MAG: sugar phosphate isomerase/epimerase [Planctomycetes bacterium]|nr:sugar phosphate isomerase/epimerase [Planctomycetota bacterium]
MKGIATNRWPWSSEASRPQEEKTVENFLAEAAEAGYDAVEFVQEVGDVSVLVQKHGLKVCGAYVGGPLHLPWEQIETEKMLAVARQLGELGADYLNVNSDPKGNWNERERKTDEDLKRQGENLSRLAEEVKPLGLSVLLHNHANTKPLHLDDLKSVTDYADPSVGICLDTGWALTSEDDPVDCARRLGKRLGGLHLRNQRGDVPVEWLGEGDMDVAAFLDVLKENDYDGWLTTELWHRNDVEVTRSLLEDQKRTVELLRKLWGE